MSSQYKSLSFILVASIAVLCPTVIYFYYSSHSSSHSHLSSSKHTDSNTESNREITTSDNIVRSDTKSMNKSCLVVYATTSGTAKKLAQELVIQLRKKLRNNDLFIDTVDIKDFNEEKLHEQRIVLFILSTWSDGEPTVSASRFMTWLRDVAYDFRWDKNHLDKLQYAIFGIGGAVYKDNFCKWAIETNKLLHKLGGRWILPVSLGDDQSNLESKFTKWSQGVETWLIKECSSTDIVTSTIRINTDSSCECGETEDSCCKSESKTKKTHETCCNGSVSKMDGKVKVKEITNDDNDNYSDGACGEEEKEKEGDDDEEEEDKINRQYIEHDEYDDKKESDDENMDQNDGVTRSKMSHTFKGIEDDEPIDGSVIDLEDIGKAKISQELQQSLKEPSIPRDMVTKLQRKALTKEGYRIIGSHSAVKLCRWTKNQMRGRGGCYKHTFYGITSYQCMEATPSLACANKCVFCWRHHKNPVGTEWRWKEDEPEFIIKEAISLHQNMINQMRGVPDVLPERLQEGMTVRHCALSLVGEPIMYPRINEMLKQLHIRGISSFLVTNAQFPDRIKQLDPVTQLYVSVDAASKDSLKAIDRPLFKDFWDRYIDSLKSMRIKQQRTVYRLTLVKSWNMNEIDEYSSLVELGQPDFIEIKAVTYCGKSDASSLTMKNVPWHVEVCQFAEAIALRLIERGQSVKYSIATEHEHSCCILLAREDKFLVNGIWHTWINYTQFQELIKQYYDSNGQFTFTSTDYMAATPDWAIYKNEAKGFDPKEKRWKRTKTGSVIEIPYEASESGCG